MPGFPFDKTQIEVVEKRIIKRLAVSNLFQAVLVAFNIERGGVYTIKQLFINPGELVLGFIGVDRLKYTGPFKLLFISTTITFIVLGYSDAASEFMAGFSEGIKSEDLNDFLAFTKKYFNVTLWLYIPIAAFFTWLVNRKRHFNYAENLAFQAYFFALTNIITMFVVLDRVLPSIIISIAITGALTFYNVYMYKHFFSKTWVRSIVESICLYIFNSIFYILLLGMAAGIYVSAMK